MARRIFTFSRFALDLDRCVLLDGEQEIAMRPKSFEVLHFLVRHAGVVVSQKKLLDAVWGDTVVTEDSVRQCIADARRALDDRGHNIIRTVPRRGYIFDLPLNEEPAPKDAAGQSRFRIAKSVAAGLVLLLIAAGAFRFLGDDTSEPAPHVLPEPPPNSIAVLRFADMSPDADHAYLAEGLAEEILHHLAQSPSLRVTARTSSFAVDGEPIDSVGEKLNVAHVLEGSVRRAGDQLRVTVQLVDTATSVHRWSKTYDSHFRNILGIQTEIAEAVASHLDSTLGERTSGGTIDSGALEHLMQAKFLYLRRRGDDLQRAEVLFREALDVDPQYAEAWAGLAAIANVRLRGSLARDSDPVRREEIRETQRHAIEQALQFGRDLPQVQMRAAAYYWYNGERERGREHLEKAQKLDPDHWLVLSARASELVSEKRLNEALDVMRDALQLDPLNAITQYNLAWVYVYAGRYEDALLQLGELDRLNPATARDPQTKLLFAKTLILLGRYDEATAIVGSLPEGRLQSLGLALVSYAPGYTADSEEVLSALQAAAEEPADLLAVAEVHAHHGDAAQALAWLSRLEPHLGCGGAVKPREAYYSPFLARLDHEAGLHEWRQRAARRMADCRY